MKKGLFIEMSSLIISWLEHQITPKILFSLLISDSPSATKTQRVSISLSEMART
jgi:hypothetical protein